MEVLLRSVKTIEDESKKNVNDPNEHREGSHDSPQHIRLLNLISVVRQAKTKERSYENSKSELDLKHDRRVASDVRRRHLID